MSKMKCKILEKAAEMFIRIGFKSVTMDDISKDLSISKKTIYSHFKNKKELVDEVTGYMFDHINKGIDAIRDKKLDAIEELFEIKQYVLKTLKDEQSSPQYQLEKFFPEIHKKLKNKHLSIVHTCIIDNIKRGIENNVYRNNINIDFISRIYFTGITGIKDLETFPISLYQQTDLMEYFLDYHIRAIATQKGLLKLEQLLTKK